MFISQYHSKDEVEFKKDYLKKQEKILNLTNQLQKLKEEEEKLNEELRIKTIIAEKQKKVIEELQNMIKYKRESQENNEEKEKELSRQLEEKIELIKQKDMEIKFIQDEIIKIQSLNLLENEDKEIIDDGEKISIHFVSEDKEYNFNIDCKKSNSFVQVEEKIYEKFPELVEYNNNFFINGKKIKRFYSLEENGIFQEGQEILMVIGKDNNQNLIKKST